MRKLAAPVGIWAVAMTVCFHCCSSSVAPVGGSATTPSDVSAGATGAIDGTFATYGQLEGNLAVVVWSDIEATRSSSGTENGVTTFAAEHLEVPRRAIRWESQVTDDGRGSVNVNGIKLDLADGRLLLVTVSAGRPVIKQLDFGVEQFDDGDLLESLRGWLESELSIRSFFRRTASQIATVK